MTERQKHKVQVLLTLLSINEVEEKIQNYCKYCIFVGQGQGSCTRNQSLGLGLHDNFLEDKESHRKICLSWEPLDKRFDF